MSASDDIHLIPDLSLIKYRYLLGCSEYKNKDVAKKSLFLAIEDKDMKNFYLELCEQFHWDIDQNLLSRLTTRNEKEIAAFDAKIADAEENLGETEVRESLLAKANYYNQIGDKENALSTYRKAEEKTVAIGQRLDIVFTRIRIGIFHNDYRLIKENIEKANDMIEEGGDWDRRNRLKIYSAIESLMNRNFEKASQLFTETLETFTAFEIIDFETFIFYTIVTSMISLDRVSLKKKVVDSPEILSVSQKLGVLETFLRSYYEGNYRSYFEALLAVMDKIHLDCLLHQHYKWIFRELRVRAYTQFLESYKSVQLQWMADEFGVSVDFIDREVSEFIATGRLRCTIDKVDGKIETNRFDERNGYYNTILKNGDALLNRVQKLSRVVNL